ncbi:unnamed protein product [Miscanthus lutarioriparius]|uniref:RING-type domain-containing protein n=1 Tax=Miscanthus lutarioriparius TaxID=422564 RepID=A0A811QK80_9POAL|nr:unnamed protein product [Miscanthus lutarioriparius]
MSMQSMNSRRQGQRYRRIHVLTGPMARMVQPIPASSSIHPYDHLFDDYLFDDDLFDDDDYLAAAPAHRSSSSKRSRVAATSEEAILSPQEVTGRSRSGSGEECAVCLQDFRADEMLRAMPCSHAFHQHCISEWLRRNVVCPLCRRRLPDEEDKQRRRI